MSTDPMIPLWAQGAPEPDGIHCEKQPAYSLHLLREADPTACVVICPGGGYGHHAPHEELPVARWLNGLGISAMVIHYRTAPHRHPTPWMDTQRAVRLCRHHARDWRLRTDRIGVLGFSAGGHVCATAATLWDDADPSAPDPIDRHSSRPDALVLCYPVITMGPLGHSGSRNNLLGANPTPELIEKLSCERQVTNRTPPTFLWHTQDDGAVPVENSLLFAQALRAHKVPFALHVFASGWHGLGLADGGRGNDDRPDINRWTTLCADWFKQQGFTK
jgi:acetyl esterase/lipase